MEPTSKDVTKIPGVGFCETEKTRSEFIKHFIDGTACDWDTNASPDQHERPSARMAQFTDASPVKSLPPEILITVFTWYMESYNFPVVLPRRPEDTIPWTLVQVCSLWRGVIFGMTKIWTNLTFHVPPPTKTCTAVRENIYSLFQDILSRHNYPITLSVEPQAHPFSVELVTTISRRIRRLDMHKIDPKSSIPLFTLPPDSFPYLESLRLDFGELIGSISQPRAPALSFLTAPKLQMVIYSDDSRSRICPDELLLLPWAQITTLDVSDFLVTLTVMHNTLSQATALISCKFFVYDSTDFTPQRRTPYTLSNLSSLFVSLIPSDSFDWEYFMGPLVLPSLHEFELHFEWMTERNLEWLEAFTSLITRSRCALDKLLVTPPDFIDINRARDFLPLVHVLPSIKYFNIGEAFRASFFQSLCTEHLLASLTSSTWIVTPDGMAVLLDWLIHMSRLATPERRLKFYIHCLLHPNFKLVWKYFFRLNDFYETRGLDVSLHAWDVGQVSSMNDLEYFFDPSTDAETADTYIQRDYLGAS